MMKSFEVVLPKNASALEIHQEAMSVAKDIKTNYLKLFEILLAVEEKKIYFKFEIPNLLLYCMELLELSKHTSLDFINVVRTSLEVPELAEAIRSKKLTVSKARKICSVLDSVNPKGNKGWIDLAIHCSCREVEKTVAMANPKAAVQETMKYVSGDALEFKMGVSEEWAEELAKLKDSLSQKLKRAVSSEEALFILMREHNLKNDPVEKAKRAKKRAEKQKSEPQASSGSHSRHRPAAVEHALNLRDENRCTYIDRNGKRCESKRWLEKHHIHHFADGGEHSIDNIETLCSAHHKIRHLKQPVIPFVT